MMDHWFHTLTNAQQAGLVLFGPLALAVCLACVILTAIEMKRA